MTKEMNDAKPEVESPETRLKVIAETLDKLLEEFTTLDDEGMDKDKFEYSMGMVLGSLPNLSSLAKGEIGVIQYGIADCTMRMTVSSMYIRRKAENDEKLKKELKNLRKKSEKEMREDAKKMKKEIKKEMKNQKMRCGKKQRR